MEKLEQLKQELEILEQQIIVEEKNLEPKLKKLNDYRNPIIELFNSFLLKKLVKDIKVEKTDIEIKTKFYGVLLGECEGLEARSIIKVSKKYDVGINFENMGKPNCKVLMGSVTHTIETNENSKKYHLILANLIDLINLDFWSNELAIFNEFGLCLNKYKKMYDDLGKVQKSRQNIENKIYYKKDEIKLEEFRSLR